LCFAKADYEKAVETYDLAIEAIKLLRGSSIGEFLAVKTLANQASTYLKLNEFEKVIATCNLALTVPSVLLDMHLMIKILHRKAVALGGMKKYEAALEIVDRAIGMGETSLTANLDELREDLIKTISSTKIIAILPRPTLLSDYNIGEIISQIFSSKGDPSIILPILEE
jgi:tetratricopeptide (TPR) repeat protein